MTSLLRISKLMLIGFLLAVVLPTKFTCQADTAPVPAVFQDLYTTLQSDLDSFNTTLASQWNGVKYPVVFSANLWNANANGGPQLPSSGSVASIQAQLQELKAMGVQSVTVAMGFPMLYEPFFASQSQYQDFVTFYQNVAASVRAQGLKLVIDNECLRNGQVMAGWNTAPFYASLTWDQYQQARAQTAVVIAQTMQPDYMVVLEEPDTEAMMTGQSNLNTVAGSTSMLSQIMTSLQQANITNVKFGAGVGTWLNNYQQFIQSYVAFPLDFIDMHVLPVNYNFLPNAVTIANIAAGAGKPVTMSQAWLRKARNNELTTLTPDQLLARDPFSFWAPLDTYYLQTIQSLAYYTKMSFVSPVESVFFWAYLPYDDTTSLLSPADIINQATTQASQSMMAAIFSTTGMNYYNAILPAPDTAPPAAPGNLTVVSGQPTQSYLNWNVSSDNVGVAGYYIFRNGVKVGTTALNYYGDTGLTEATTYSYFVEAFDLAGNVSTPSISASVTTWNTVPPSAPSNPAVTAPACQRAIFSWAPATDKIGIAYYHVFRGTSSADFGQVAITYGTSTSFTSYPMTPGVKYYFGVQAVDPDGNLSRMSPIVSVVMPALPSPPVNLVATPLTTAAVSLTWTAGPSGLGVGSYIVFRGASPSTLLQINQHGAVPTFSDYPLTAGTKYFYAVKEVDLGGNISAMSKPVPVTTLALPSPPSLVTATALGKTAITVTWTAARSGMPLSVYRVYQGTSPSSLQLFGSVSPTTLSITIYTAKSGTTYYYGVQSVDTLGNVSPMSVIAQATTTK